MGIGLDDLNPSYVLSGCREAAVYARALLGSGAWRNVAAMPLKTLNREHATPRKGRGAGINPEGRFEKIAREAFDDGWGQPPAVGEARGERGEADESLPPLKTYVTVEYAKSIISRNESPDVPFTQSINPYRGCEHGCIYCYSRPSHAYLNLSPGVDFETRLFAKVNAAELLRAELAKPGYECDVISLGANTDPYQPIEREYKITRGILEVLAECEHPVGIVTKNALVERDIDILAPMARKNLVNVYISLNNLDHDLARRLEPRCSAPARRLEAMRRLSAAGIPTGVIVAPVIPFLTDHQIEPVLEAAYAAGARSTGYVLMRLPHEVKDLFRHWLETHYPLKAKHVMSRVHQMRGGRDNDPGFGSRMRGSGEFADLLRQRFDIACERLGYNNGRRNRSLDTTRFRKPRHNGQLALF
jgi:DNA repair photolyase